MLFRSTGDSTRQSAISRQSARTSPQRCDCCTEWQHVLHWPENRGNACEAYWPKYEWRQIGSEAWIKGGLCTHSEDGSVESLIDLFLVNCENGSELKISSFFMRFSLLFALETQLPPPPPPPVPPLWGNSRWNADVQPANCQRCSELMLSERTWNQKRREKKCKPDTEDFYRTRDSSHKHTLQTDT